MSKLLLKNQKNTGVGDDHYKGYILDIPDKAKMDALPEVVQPSAIVTNITANSGVESPAIKHESVKGGMTLSPAATAKIIIKSMKKQV